MTASLQSTLHIVEYNILGLKREAGSTIDLYPVRAIKKSAGRYVDKRIGFKEVRRIAEQAENERHSHQLEG